ncbi:sel1 repeat family protein [Marinobacter sp. 1-3A]|uniref:tetratricopeptide repeat protein n=1 Tax=Marinobacter sp. 1-3A TaxID=2582920 RepID=UPI00190467C8|nr:sel1 repeat family protein [Marinobacter sp. 1-3A]MBK1873616.1 sel1 repeat family protein [Marinobacter sp. 1-3A]
MTQHSLFSQISSCVLCILCTFVAYAKEADDTAEKLFREGFVLYQQQSSARSLEKFKSAAELGHIEAAYYAGNIIRQDYTYITKESEHFYRQAAEGGDVYAMLRLGQNDSVCGILRDCAYDQDAWVDKALNTALPRAEAGDSEAMMELFSVYWQSGEKSEAFAWTKKAATHGNAFAQYWLAVGLLGEREMGFYWTKAGRREDILRWLRASAEHGYPKAMLKLALELRTLGEYQEAQHWVEEMGKTDYYDAILESGTAIMLGPNIATLYGERSDYGFAEARPVKGAALLLALHRQTNKDDPLEMIEDYQAYLTPEMMADAEALSKELLVDTPILHYLPKFGI